jgi:flagellar assembly factor FliW
MNAPVSLVASSDPATDSTAAVVESDPILFEAGVYGFPECRTFDLSAAPVDGLYWLQSTEHAALRLLLADPFIYFRGYTVDLPTMDAARLKIHEPGDVAILVTVTLPDSPGRTACANLQAPIVINVRTRQGRQVILNDRAWAVREPLELPRRG